MEHILYWLWLTTKYGVTQSKIKVLIEKFKTVEEIYFSKNFKKILDKKPAFRYYSGAPRAPAQRQNRRCGKMAELV